jgi:hypothetical protein
MESLRPLLTRSLAAFLGSGSGAGDTPEGVVEGGVDRGALERLQAILEVPNLLRDRGQELGLLRHGRVPAFEA